MVLSLVSDQMSENIVVKCVNYLGLTLENLSEAIDVLFVFMEIHMPKIVIFMAMLLCVYDKCALYLLVIVLIVLALTFGRPMMVISIFATSCFASVLLLSRMIYQIQYIEPDVWNVTCPVNIFNSVVCRVV